MLTLTQNAATAITAICDRRETGGIRISTQEQDGEPALALSTADAPYEGDQVVENEGARVFLEPQAAVALDDKTLDAHVDADGRVQFLVSPS